MIFQFLRIILLTWVLSSVNAVLNPFTLLLQLYKQQGLKFREDPFLNNGPILQEYDFIVVGSGPAGCVVTNRLTENPRWKVLLLEAGTEENIYIDPPSMSPYLLNTEYNWNFKTEKSSQACLGLKDRMCPWPAGKAVGGSSVINGMIYTRGNKRDYDRWADAGNEGWSYEEVLPYFLKSEDIQIPYLKLSPYHSNQGNVTVTHARYETKANNVFLKAGRELNISYTDYNGAKPLGMSKIQETQRNGRRVSAAKAFLFPIKDRQNFHVSQNSRVTKVLIDPTSKRAYGVEFKKKNKIRRVFARNEVILSAGAFMSPFILMHSGIGPKEHLAEIGIPIIQDLRVGDNLQEHLTMAGLSFLMNDTSLTVDLPSELLKLPVHFLEWYTEKKVMVK